MREPTAGGFRAAPGTAFACLAMGVAAAVASVTYTIGLREVIDGAIAHDSGEIAFGGALVAVLFTASWVLAIVSGTEGTMLTDRVNLVLGCGSRGRRRPCRHSSISSDRTCSRGSSS